MFYFNTIKKILKKNKINKFISKFFQFNKLIKLIWQKKED